MCRCQEWTVLMQRLRPLRAMHCCETHGVISWDGDLEMATQGLPPAGMTAPPENMPTVVTFAEPMSDAKCRSAERALMDLFEID